MRRLRGLGLGLVPFVLLCGIVTLWHDTVPLFDEWYIGKYLQMHDAGTLGFGEFWDPYNGHRILLPKLVLYGLARVTHWTLAYETVLNLLLALGTFVLLAYLARRTIEQPTTQALTIGAIGGVLFSPLAWQNWLWGWQIAWYMVNAGLVLALAALIAMPRVAQKYRFALAVVGATIATLSLGHGALTWIVCAPIFFLRREWRRWAPAWLALMAALFTVFALGYHTASNGDVLGSPGVFLHYAANFVVRPLSYEGRFGLLAAAALIGAAVVVARRGRRLLDDGLPWLLLIAFAVMSSLSTAAGRIEFGTGQANESRYTTVSGLLVIGLVVLLAQNLDRVAVVAAAVVLLLAAVNYVEGVKEAERHYSEIMVPRRQCAQTARSVSDPCVAYTQLGSVWPILQFLRSHGLGGL